jgi:hypothetical protein
MIIMQRNQQHLVADQEELGKNLDLLNSGAPDAEILPHLKYVFSITKSHDAAWSAAKIDGSLALIPSSQINHATYFYASHTDLVPTLFAYFNDMGTAEALVDHAAGAGKLTAFERRQLLTLTASAMGHNRLIFSIFSFEIRALQSNDLQ